MSLNKTEKVFEVKSMLPPGKIISPTFSLTEISYLIYATCLAPVVANAERNTLGGDSPHLKLGVSDRENHAFQFLLSLSLSPDNRWLLKSHLQLHVPLPIG